MLFPESAVAGIAWPAVPGGRAARLLAILAQFERSQWLSAEQLQAQQARQLGRLLVHAYQTVPHYRRVFDAADLPPEKVRGELQWRRLPTLRRSDLQAAGDAVHSQRLPDGHGPAAPIVTSGSTGRPVVALSSAITQLFWQALTIREHLWHGRDLSKKLAAIRFVPSGGCEPPQGRITDNWGSATRGLFRTGPCAILSIRSSIAEQADWLLRQDPEYLLSYPSALFALARWFRRQGRTLPRLREVRSFGEVLEPNVRETCREAWGRRVVDMYSAQEVGYLGLECPVSGLYHVPAETVLVEVLDAAGRPCPAGRIGRVVATPLHNFACPLIRYELGDFAEVGPPCPCGRGLPTLRRILGRKRNLLVLPGGELRWPSIQVDSADAGSLPPVRQFQVVQKTLEDVEAVLVVDRPLAAEEEARLRGWLEQGLGHAFRVTFRYVERIEPGPTGKYEDFRSEAPWPEEGDAR